MYFKLVNGFCLGIMHEGFPEEDAWVITVMIGPLIILFGRNVEFGEEGE